MLLVISWILGFVNLFLWLYPAIFYPFGICGLFLSVMANREKLVHSAVDVIPIVLNALALFISIANLIRGWILVVVPRL